MASVSRHAPVRQRAPRSAQETATEIGDTVYARGVDVTDAAAVMQAAKDAEAAHGPIDILVTSAGIAGPTVKTWEYPLEQWDRVMKINVDGTFYCCRAVVPSMIGAGLPFSEAW